MDKIVAIMMLVMISFVSMSIVLTTAGPSLDRTKAAVAIREAESSMKFLDNAVKEVADGGNGTKRMITVASFGTFEVIPEEAAIEFSSPSGGIFEYLSRRFSGNMEYIGGNDVTCSSEGNLSMQNTYIKAVFTKIQQTSPPASLNTSENIMSLQDKISGKTIDIVDSAIEISDNASTSYGNGYSEISRTGSGFPVCVVHFFVNSTKDYDVYYTLYAGADFVVADIRNIRD